MARAAYPPAFILGGRIYKCLTLSPVFLPISSCCLVRCIAYALHHLLVSRTTHALWFDPSSVLFVPTVCISPIYYQHANFPVYIALPLSPRITVTPHHCHPASL